MSVGIDKISDLRECVKSCCDMKLHITSDQDGSQTISMKLTARGIIFIFYNWTRRHMGERCIWQIPGLADTFALGPHQRAVLDSNISDITCMPRP